MRPWVQVLVLENKRIKNGFPTIFKTEKKSADLSSIQMSQVLKVKYSIIVSKNNENRAMKTQEARGLHFK